MDDSRNAASDPCALPPGEPSTIPATTASTPPLAGCEPIRLYDLANSGVLLRHRWTVIAVFLVVVMAAMVQTFTTRPIYSAKATLRIEKEEPRVIKFDEVVRSDPQPDYYETQYKLLQSRALANRAIGPLELDQHREFAAPESEMSWAARAQGWVREQLVHWMPLPPPPASEGTDDLILESPLTRAILGRLTVQPIRNIRLVEVSFQSHYPDLAARVVNTVAEAFITQQVGQRIEVMRYATQFLAKQIEEVCGKLEEFEAALTQFLRANNILFVVPDSNEGRPQDLITKHLTILSDALLKGRADRINKESQFHQAMSQEAGSTPAVLQSDLIATLKEEQATLEGEFRELKLTFKRDYPKVQRLTESFGEVRRQIQTEVKRVVDALKAEYQASLCNETQLEKALVEQKGQVRQLDEQMGQYNLLRREVNTNRDLPNTLHNRLRETQIASALLTSNMSIVDRAEVPGQPSRPRKMLNLLLASVVRQGAGLSARGL
jgi:polysaccharide biosynthesis transport protein